MAGEVGATNSWFDSKPLGQVGGAYMANNTQDDLFKKNPLSNENLPGGLFTHPGVC